MFQCRFYEEEWPVKGQIVVVKIKEIHEHGISCSLLEYNEIEGYVPISELSRRRIISKTQSEMKKGQLDLAKVVAVDAVRGFIDLNKEELPQEVVSQATVRWNNSKKVHSIMKHVAQRIGTPIEELYQKFVWPLARDMRKLGNNHAIMGLLFFHEDPESMARKYGLQKKFVHALMPSLRERLKPQQHKITALVEARSTSKQGNMLIKRTLKAAALVSTPSCPVQIVQRERSIWEVRIHTLKPLEGSTMIWQILEKIRRVLTFGGRGHFRLIKSPTMLDPYNRESDVICQDPEIHINESPLIDAVRTRTEGNSSRHIISPCNITPNNLVHSYDVDEHPYCLLDEEMGDGAPEPSTTQKNLICSSPHQKHTNYLNPISLTTTNNQSVQSPKFTATVTSPSSDNGFRDQQNYWKKLKSNKEASSSTVMRTEEIPPVLSENQDNAYKQAEARPQLSSKDFSLEDFSATSTAEDKGVDTELKTGKNGVDDCERSPFSLTPLYMPSIPSLDDKFSSPSIEVIQHPSLFKCHSYPKSRHRERSSMCHDSSDSISPRISPKGLTLRQQKFLRELLSEEQCNDPNVSSFCNKSKFTEPNELSEQVTQGKSCGDEAGSSLVHQEVEHTDN